MRECEANAQMDRKVMRRLVRMSFFIASNNGFLTEFKNFQYLFFRQIQTLILIDISTLYNVQCTLLTY